MFGSIVVPDLLDTQNKVRARSIFARKARICAGSVGIQNQQLGCVGLFSKGHAKHFRA